MRLLTATLRNYRIHRELHVTFDPARTVVGGPNESGKSTLVEAIHRALFLRHKISGDALQSMVSRQGLGPPEVEVTFEMNGHRYTIRKRFGSQAQGYAAFSQEGGPSWQGDEAEGRLANLLGTGEPASGRGAVDRLKEYWGHLWLRQGSSGDEPLHSSRTQHANVLQRLQTQQGAVVGQSSLDEQVAALIEAELGAYKTPTGKAKAGGPLEAAIQGCAQAKDALEDKQTRLQTLLDAIAGSELARQSLGEAQQALGALAPQRAALQEREAALLQRQEQDKTLNAEAHSLRQMLGSLQAIEAEITDLRERLNQSTTTAAPRRRELADTREALAAAVAGYDEAQQELLHAQAGVVQAREQQALAEALTRRMDKATELKHIREQVSAAEERQKKLQAHEQALARLPQINSADVARLTQLTHAVEQAAASLSAMAAGIEILSAPGPVRVAREAIGAGEKRVVSEPTDIELPDGTRLRIHPGGGDALRQAREASAQAQASLRETLSVLTVSALEEAVGIADTRAGLEQALATLAAELKATQADTLPTKLAQVQAAQDAAEAEVERRSVSISGETPLPETQADAQRWLQELQIISERAEVARLSVEKLKAHREDARERLRAEVEAAENALRQAEAESSRIETLLNDRLRAHGTDVVRAEALAQAGQAVAQAEQGLNALRQEIEILQPEALGLERERLERATTLQTERAAQAEESLRQHTYTLRSDGSLDPASEVAWAQAELERAEAERTRVEQRVAALELLLTRFREQRRHLVERYTAPLVARIEDYARYVFGTRTRLKLLTDENTGALAEVQLDRGVNHSFAELSQGAKEQLSVAVRLAIAEVLAEAQGQGLPVVLDDAFANADPARVQLLQGMLDLAAARGLQVVVVSCTPGDYAGLGARMVLLPTN